MSLFQNLFGSTKGKTKTQNPALAFVQEKYGLNAGPYLKAAEVIHAHAFAAANEFAELLTKKPTEDTVHFFFDLFCANLFSSSEPRLLPRDRNAASAIIDGFHLEYYGNTSPQISTTMIAYIGSGDPCLFRSFLEIFGNDNAYQSIVSLAVLAVDKNHVIGATDALRLFDPLLKIQREKLDSIKSMLDIILN